MHPSIWATDDHSCAVKGHMSNFALFGNLQSLHVALRAGLQDQLVIVALRHDMMPVAAFTFWKLDLNLYAC